ncbi:MAG: class I SAM-dependent methyltransferase [Bryobacteraceae bacterium]
MLAEIGGTVVEIGPGTGANFLYYQRGIRWIGVEPNQYMHPYLHRAAETAGIENDIRSGRAEQLDLDDQCADAVVGTAVLCSIEDPIRALREIRRVLKPGGRFVFVEHVAAESGTSLCIAQRMLQPFWSCIADGCHPARDTAGVIIKAGFEPIIFDSFRLPLGPFAPHIAGIAVPKN